MLKKIRTISAALMLLCGMAACLPEYNTQHDINIARFYFRASDTAPDINSIEFAVDTVAMTITNADSLAFTSSLAQVVPVIECYSVPSAIAINGVEWNQTDTLDLSVQPVKVTIIGSDKVTSCDVPWFVRCGRHLRGAGWQPLLHGGVFPARRRDDCVRQRERLGSVGRI